MYILQTVRPHVLINGHRPPTWEKKPRRATTMRDSQGSSVQDNRKTDSNAQIAFDALLVYLALKSCKPEEKTNPTVLAGKG